MVYFCFISILFHACLGLNSISFLFNSSDFFQSIKVYSQAKVDLIFPGRNISQKTAYSLLTAK